MANGYILWEGESLLDGTPIVVIATGFASRSTNRKTGGMIQTYILRRDIDPVSAVRTGKDASVCGDCIHRGTTLNNKNSGRTCYVNVGQGALAVWKSYLAGGYPRWACVQRKHGEADGRKVRLGTYGDPAAVPAYIWQTLLLFASGHTGYTHQWRNPALSVAQHQFLQHTCMASADSPEEAAFAQSMGWRTFRVGRWGETERDRVRLSESLCPASAEAGKKLTCEECLACDGAGVGERGTRKRGSIFIPAHGGTAVMANIRKRGERQLSGMFPENA